MIGKDVPDALLRAIADRRRGRAAARAGRAPGGRVPVRGEPVPGAGVHVQARPDPRGGVRQPAPGAAAGAPRAGSSRRSSELYADRLAEQVERLAHHALRGERWEQAVSYCAPGRRTKAWPARPTGGGGVRSSRRWRRWSTSRRRRDALGAGDRPPARAAERALAARRARPHSECLAEAEQLAEALGDRHRLAGFWYSLCTIVLRSRRARPGGRAGEQRRRPRLRRSTMLTFAGQRRRTLGQALIGRADYRRAIEQRRAAPIALLEGDARSMTASGRASVPSISSRLSLVRGASPSSASSPRRSRPGRGRADRRGRRSAVQPGARLHGLRGISHLRPG